MADSISSGTNVDKNDTAIPQVGLNYSQHHRGRGTLDDPFIIEWLPDEQDHPM